MQYFHNFIQAIHHSNESSKRAMIKPMLYANSPRPGLDR